MNNREQFKNISKPDYQGNDSLIEKETMNERLSD